MKNSNSLPAETSEIGLRLEQYDDIFSDFDVRPYAQRALSVDFLEEIKRAAFDKADGAIELILHAPAAERDEAREATIKERLNAHFQRHHNALLKDKRRVLKLGVSMVFVGILAMIAATLILFNDPHKSLLMSFLIIFLEPAAWFLLWEGMDQIVFNSKNINPNLVFYRKMAHADGHIVFKSY